MIFVNVDATHPFDFSASSPFLLLLLMLLFPPSVAASDSPFGSDACSASSSLASSLLEVLGVRATTSTFESVMRMFSRRMFARGRYTLSSWMKPRVKTMGRPSSCCITSRRSSTFLNTSSPSHNPACSVVAFFTHFRRYLSTTPCTIDAAILPFPQKFTSLLQPDAPRITGQTLCAGPGLQPPGMQRATSLSTAHSRPFASKLDQQISRQGF
mmetsp:Transcript_36283/g.85994  ORF Transcript_36283/g.85994 Transcript_36283/m.85994 type:complete len:212 (-) Transcript_36283:2-637(-)